MSQSIPSSSKPSSGPSSGSAEMKRTAHMVGLRYRLCDRVNEKSGPAPHLAALSSADRLTDRLHHSLVHVPTDEVAVVLRDHRQARMPNELLNVNHADTLNE